MKSATIKLIILAASIGLTSCSQPPGIAYDPNPPYYAESQISQPQDPVATTQLASNGLPELAMRGHIGRTFDVNDKSKMAHALDSPLGKSTQWVNENTGTTYTVIPKRKVTIGGNPYCREYTTTITKGNKTREHTSSACVDANGKWQVSGG